MQFDHSRGFKPCEHDGRQRQMGDIEDKSKRLTEYDTNIINRLNGEPDEFLRREILYLPLFDPPQHPFCRYPGDQVHPVTGQSIPKTFGNDNSSVNRQSRNHTTPPDPVPGEPYTGHQYHKIGQALLGIRPPKSFSQLKMSEHSIVCQQQESADRGQS